MSEKIYSDYLETYSRHFAEKVCGEYFGTKKYMDGQEIIRLTPSNQVNLLVIKTIFVVWQEEMEKLKNNPYFNYRDLAVKEVLKDLMNVLSRAIRIEREDFEPLLQAAVRDAILLAIDPVTFFEKEISKAHTDQLANYLKESKRYIKWHSLLLDILVEKASSGASSGELKRALGANYEYKKDQLESAANLLEPLGQVDPIIFEDLYKQESASLPDEKELQAPVQVSVGQGQGGKSELRDQPQHRAAEGSKAIDPALAWAKFESEQYSYMKGSVGELTENVGINQRFMFTKVLFEGNHDLMMHALKSVDESDNFVEAIEMLNQRYVAELDWDIDSEEVGEFLQLIFRKFDHKS